MSLSFWGNVDLGGRAVEGFGSRRGQSLLTNAALIVVTVLSLHSLSNVSDLDRNTV